MRLNTFLSLFLWLGSASQAAPAPVQKTVKLPVFVHLMPWFESKDFSGSWGIHWTMNTRNPDLQENGIPQIASHYHPLTGPYASADPDLIEYQLLLMKLSGIDGVMIDWPGTTVLYDYPRNRSNALALIEKLHTVGLKYLMVYEDQNIKIAAERGVVTDRVEQARADLKDLEQNHFSRPEYFHLNERPVLTVFGPQTFEDPSQWADLFSGLQEKPCFLSLWHEGNQISGDCKGETSWVYQDHRPHLEHLQSFYQAPRLNRVRIGSAYPGFHDFYQEGGWGNGYFDIPVSLNTFKTTLDLGLKADLQALQLVTWNDYGEGTMIEPTLEFGFVFLEVLQERLGVQGVQGKDLKLVLELYQQRKKFAGDGEQQKRLDTVFGLLCELKVEEAREVLRSYGNSRLAVPG